VVQWTDPRPGAWLIAAACGWSLAVILAIALILMHWRTFFEAAASCQRLLPVNQRRHVDEELWLDQDDL
jgi:hypothetical protein